jgi:beta-glucanase (GH16 family)
MFNFSRIIYTFSILAPCFLFTACSKKGSNNTPALPVASINSVSQERSTTGSVFQFTVTLSQASGNEVSLDYTTVAGSAAENTDFKPISGTLNIPANQVAASISVDVTGDSLRKVNQIFYVQLNNPKNCTIGTGQGTGTIINEDVLYFPVDNTGYSTPTSYPGYTLVWSDEFAGNTINQNNWTFETGNNNGWGNNELENYTDGTQNAFVSQGNLIIEARQENYGGNSYTSARMKTEDKQIFTYGRVDIRAKLPAGQGLWPALWLLGNNINTVGWPACGEIDMMELLGQVPNKVYGTIHWGADPASGAQYGTTYTLPSGSFDQQFHVYSMLWQQDSIKLYIDDQQYFSASKADVSGTYPFNSNFFFIFNVAIGGNFPGSPDGTTTFPQRMVVDYIRVFQQ